MIDTLQMLIMVDDWMKQMSKFAYFPHVEEYAAHPKTTCWCFISHVSTLK